MTNAIDCPICGAQNAFTASSCYLCDSELSPEIPDDLESLAAVVEKPSEEVFFDMVDSSHSSVSWKKLAFALCLLLAMGTPWLLMWDLYTKPKDVLVSRDQFSRIKTNYLVQKKMWLDRKEQVLQAMKAYNPQGDMVNEVLAFDSIPLEVLLAYFDDELDLLGSRFQSFSLYPVFTREKPTILLSKFEEKRWPVPILLSLEVALSFDEGQLNVDFVTMRRGKREIHPNLAWEYFGNELQVLRTLEQYSGGVTALTLYERSDLENVNDISTNFASWEYVDRSLL